MQLPAHHARLARAMALGFFACLGAVSFAAEADAPEPRRPRTALVLSGGGARGAAHVGVLKVLEELHVPVDYVVGTSMGSVVGGLYAVGLSPEQIDRLIDEIDWEGIFNDRPERRRISFRRKQLDALSLFQLEFGVSRRGLTFASGLISGQKLGLILRRQTLHTAGIDDFDDLAIPFRSVAADLATGDVVVLDRGDLTEAIRASMAIPGVISPVEIEGRLLVDGGIARNLPVDVARELGAERIIAVDISTPVGELGRDLSLLGVAKQTVMVLTDKNVQDQRRLIGAQDLLILPQLETVGSASFERMHEAVERGESAARVVQDRLQRFAVEPAEFEAYLKRQRAALTPPTEIVVEEIVVTGLERVDPRIVRTRIRSRPGLPIDLDELEDDVERVYQIGEFQHVDFRLTGPAGRRRVQFHAREKPWGPNYLRFGLTLEATLDGESDFGARAVFERTQLNRLGAELRSLVSFGDEDVLFGEFYQPLHPAGTWFVAPQIELGQTRLPVADADGAIALEDFELATVRFDVGAQLGDYGEVRLGIERGRIDRDLFTTLSEGSLNSDTGAWRLSAALDQLDSPHFPRRGQLVQLDVRLSRRGLGADERFDRTSLLFLDAQSWGANTLVGLLQYGSSGGARLPPHSEFSLGGFLDLSGLDPGELRGDELGYLSMIYYRQIAKVPGASLYLGGAVEAGATWFAGESRSLDDLRPSALLLAGAETVLGPVYLGYGRSDRGAGSFYVFVGQPFGRRLR